MVNENTVKPVKAPKDSMSMPLAFCAKASSFASYLIKLDTFIYDSKIRDLIAYTPQA